MATTAQQVFNLAMALIDEMMNDGTISTTQTKSYSAKTPNLLSLLQSELLKEGTVFSTYLIANKPLENLLGYAAEFDIKAFEGTEYTCEANKSAKAYYFEADRAGTVYVEDYTNGWNTLETITTTNTPEGFTAYKGVVTPTNGATKSRLRFTGSYYYRSVNRALFSVAFALDDDIPDYRPWVKHQMPADFQSVDTIVNESLTQYGKDASYKWEGRRDLYISYTFDGQLRIQYRPVPSLIAALTDNVAVDDITARTILPYGLAAHLMLKESPETASFFNGRYEELKSVPHRQPVAFEEITDVYGGM